MNQKEKIEAAVFEAIDEYNGFHPEEQKLDKNTSTVLFSRSGFTKEGRLDSIGLVNLIVLVEEKMKNTFGTQVKMELPDMIREKEKVLKNLASLIEYLHQFV